MIDGFFNAFAAAENDMMGAETAKLRKVLRLRCPDGSPALSLVAAEAQTIGDTVVVLASPDGKPLGAGGYVAEKLTVTVGGHTYAVARDSPRLQDGTVSVVLATPLLAVVGVGNAVALSEFVDFDLPHSLVYTPREGFVPGEAMASFSTAISVPKLTAEAEPKTDDILTCSLGTGEVLGFLPPDGGSWEVLVGRAGTPAVDTPRRKAPIESWA